MSASFDEARRRVNGMPLADHRGGAFVRRPNEVCAAVRAVGDQADKVKEYLSRFGATR